MKKLNKQLFESKINEMNVHLDQTLSDTQKQEWCNFLRFKLRANFDKLLAARKLEAETKSWDDNHHSLHTEELPDSIDTSELNKYL